MGLLSSGSPEVSSHGGEGSSLTLAAHAEAFGALRHMGFGETESKRALAEARSHVGPQASLEQIIRAALAVATGRAGA